MRVWIFNHYATSPAVPGGTRHFSLAKELINRGHEVVIFAASFHYNHYVETQQYEEGASWKEEIIEGVRFIWFKTKPYQTNNWKRYLNILDFTIQVKKFDYSRFPHPDIIVGSSFHLFAPWVAKGIAKKLSVPFVSEVRDLWPETLRALGAPAYHPLVLFLGIIEKKIYKASSRIVVLFPRAHEYILNLNLGISRDHIVRIPNGVDCRQITGNTIPLTEDSPLNFMSRKDGKLRILNAGSLGNVYCLDQLVNAMKILQDEQVPAHLYFVGSGVKEAELKEQVAQLKLQNVSFHKPISRALIPTLLDNADVLYASLMDSPLYKWGMSLNKLHEYLAAAKPIVFGYNQQDNPVQQSGCGYTVPPDNPRAIADAFKNVAKASLEVREAFGRKGRAFAMAEYDFQELGKKMEALLLASIQEYNKK